MPESDVSRRQNVTSRDGPRAKKVNQFSSSNDEKYRMVTGRYHGYTSRPNIIEIGIIMHSKSNLSNPVIIFQPVQPVFTTEKCLQIIMWN